MFYKSFKIYSAFENLFVTFCLVGLFSLMFVISSILLFVKLLTHELFSNVDDFKVAILLGSSVAIDQLLTRPDDYGQLDLERLFSNHNLDAESRDYHDVTPDYSEYDIIELMNDTVIPVEELVGYEELPTPLPASATGEMGKIQFFA